VKARKTYATQQCWRFLRLLEGVQHQNRARREIGLGPLHINVAWRGRFTTSSGLFGPNVLMLRGSEMQNANPKVGVLLSPSAI
jgi:hypothetical protein